ncbi:conserved hypothetical protein [Xenorhabdus bovienii str. feltiae Moldova]|uniref:Uncharacterized protein n=1 Tax=Xenorhabdus bovienii str. feltiae Moldova TaxID=1398200 RepID=A0A077NNU5_XENBV|nr:conserved hypothetical protein [Xenorhabdus bovienii str. feltiae Moldova]
MTSPHDAVLYVISLIPIVMPHFAAHIILQVLSLPFVLRHHSEEIVIILSSCFCKLWGSCIDHAAGGSGFTHGADGLDAQLATTSGNISPKSVNFSLGIVEFPNVFGLQFCEMLDSCLLFVYSDELSLMLRVQVGVVLVLSLILTVIEPEQTRDNHQSAESEVLAVESHLSHCLPTN